jgi:predicted ester cyclase
VTEDDIRQRLTTILTNLAEGVAKGYISPSYIHVDPLLPAGIIDEMNDSTSYAEGASRFAQSFPDYTSKPKWIVIEGDKSACRWEWSGTFTGRPFFGYPATGDRVEFTGLTMYRWENSQVQEGITLFDLVGFVKQLSNGAVDIRPFKPD